MSRLESPLSLPCGASLPNRLVKAAMTEGLADSLSRPTEGHTRLYSRWAEKGGGAGLLITGNIAVDRRYMERPGNVCIDRTAIPRDLKERLVEFAKAGSVEGKSVVWAQLSHAGRQCTPLVNLNPVGPSAVRGYLTSVPLPVPRALTVEEIRDVVERFAFAAKMCQETGFHGIQIHAAHGYLLSSFLNPKANIRTDEYGGSLENRARILLETVRAIRKTVGPKYPIGVKLNCSDFVKGGLEHRDSVQVAKWLEEEGVDLLEVSGGNYENPAMMAGADFFNDIQKLSSFGRTSTEIREAYFLVFAKDIAKALTKTPILVTGGFRSRKVMEEALISGEAHLIGIARPLCGMPNSARLLLEGKISKLPRYENDDLSLPWYFSWTQYIILGNILKQGGLQMWTYEMLIRMGEGKDPTSNIDILVLLGSVNSYDSRKAAALENLSPEQATGIALNAKPLLTTNRILLVAAFLTLLLVVRARLR